MEFEEKTVAMATCAVVGSLEDYLDGIGVKLPGGKETSKIVHDLFKQIMKYAEQELAQGHELY
jgi:hypothetical protein